MLPVEQSLSYEPFSSSSAVVSLPWTKATSCPFFFFNDPPTTEISPLPLHDALPICHGDTPAVWILLEASRPAEFRARNQMLGGSIELVPLQKQLGHARMHVRGPAHARLAGRARGRDRKSTRLNSSHGYISYAVFCLK